MKNLELFNNLYSLTKTIKFELRPIPETKKWIDEFGKIFTQEADSSEDNFFKRDMDIAEAKRIIQDVLNSVHETIINNALTSDEAKAIDISSYYELSNQTNPDLGNEEKNLREKIKLCFIAELKKFNGNFSSKEKKNQDKDDELSGLMKVLGSSYMLNYLSETAGNYASTGHKARSIKNACANLNKFWGVLSQYVENRNNYYVCDKEQDTAVATRIVSDLLPVFCKNCREYTNNKEEYDSIFHYLKSTDTTMLIKDSATGEMKTVEGFDSSIYNINEFYKYISQAGIEKYNAAISKNKVLVNLYNQQKRGSHIKGFVTLHKQIGCKEANSTEKIVICKDWDSTVSKDNGISLEAMLNKVTCMVNEIVAPKQPDMLSPRLSNLTSWLENVKDWEGIYVSDKALKTISSRYLEDWYSLQQLLIKEKSVGSYNASRESNEQFKLNSAVELAPVFRAFDGKDFESAFKKNVYNEYSEVLDRNLPLSRNLLNIMCHDLKQKIDNELPKYEENITTILNTTEHREGFFKKDNSIDVITDYLDCILSIVHIVSFFSVRQNKIKGSPYNMELFQIVSSLLESDLGNRRAWYDEIRNYLLRLPQDEIKENKLKLNFNSSQLLQGWHVNKTKDRLSLILKNEGVYHLCILKKSPSCNTLFDIKEKIYVEKSEAYRMIVCPMKYETLLKKYKPMFGHRYAEETNEADAILRFQQMIREKWLGEYPDLKLVAEKQYKVAKELKDDVNRIIKMDKYSQCHYKPIDWSLVEEYAQKGKIYVFKIHSKDYKETSKGKKDLQTIYWNDVLNGHSQHQLSANGEIFRREAISKQKPIKHSEGSVLVNKRYADGKPIPESIYNIAYAILNNLNIPESVDEKDNEKAKSLIDSKKIVYRKAWMDITKDARFYGKEKYFLHNPLCLNYKARGFANKAISEDKAYNTINPQIQERMHEGEMSPAFIGIDRGEKNLIYACKVNTDGEILFCKHYNSINGLNYLEKLEERADSRIKAKQGWKQQESIKNLKDGYISYVVHQLLDDAIPLDDENKNPSYIVLEKLSREMKQGRQNREQQIYQKFELALAKKLSFYVNKDVEEGKPGSIQMPLQFVPPVNTFDQIDRKDSFGIMLYTRANYTSVTDPLTGWRKTIYIANGNNEVVLSQLTTAFDDIYFDGKDYVFAYVEKNTGHRWLMYSGVNGQSLDRFEYNKTTKQYDAYNIVEILDKLFANFDKSSSLLKQIKEGIELKKAEEGRTAYGSLRKAINMIQQIRNTGNAKKNDNFLQSPVRNENGEHFDTRNAQDFGNLHFIKDADANGAFNIARKGIIMDAHYKYWAEQKKTTTNKMPSLSLYVSDKEWDMWLLDRKKWEDCLGEFALRS